MAPTSFQCQTGAIACEQGVDDQQIKSAVLRLTWQASPRNKISAYFDEIDKFRGHGITAGNVTDMLTASQIWTSPLYNDAVAQVDQPADEPAPPGSRASR